MLGTFVSVGNASQPFVRLLSEVGALALALPQPIIVQHGNTPFQSAVCRAIPFVGMTEYEQFVVSAELLILHAGAGSVIHAVRAGKVPVVMPRRMEFGEHVDNHQIEFAQALANAGRVVVATDPQQLSEAAARALVMQREASRGANASAMLAMIGEALDAHAQRCR